MAGVETGEHPLSSLEGVEQPSEASGGEKLELCLLLRLTSLSGDLLSATKTALPSLLHFRGQKSFRVAAQLNGTSPERKSGVNRHPTSHPVFRFP